jgi:iron complex outermembrane receptor protein
MIHRPARTRDLIVAATLGLLPASGAMAQSATNVATVALDAFGERIGSEQIGLYSEQQVRGFSLQESGNYRLDGAYFIRSANIVSVALDGTTIRVGVNALGVDFPAPSGIVEYRLAGAAPGARAELEVMRRDFGGQSILLRGSAATADGALGAAYGVNIMNERGSDGHRRYPRHLSLVPTWRPNDQFQIRGLFSADGYSRPGGDYGVVVAGSVLPPTQPNPGRFNVDWGHTRQMQLAGGVIVRYAPSERIGVQSSFVVTDLDRWRADFTRLTLGADGAGTASAIRGSPYQARSLSAETRLDWRATDSQRLFTTVRWRRSNNHVRPSLTVPLGFVDQEAGVPVTPRPPPLADTRPTRDETRQIMAGLGYEVDLSEALRLRGALQRTRYRKDVTPPGLPTQSNVDTPWLYDLAATLRTSADLTVFATAVRGLEESGTAPNNAANRNEVLPAVIARQYELGLRYRVSPTLTFISSLFDISKPTPGIDAQNVYRLIGEARHRGVEFSLAGRLAPSINVLSGLVLLDPDRRGELVDQGVLIGRAPGVASLTGLLNVTYQPPRLKGVSIDGQLNYNSRMLVSPRTGLYTPAYGTFDLGARYAFEAAGQPVTLRARIGNLFNEDQWIANRNETISRVPRRTFRLSLTTRFGA